MAKNEAATILGLGIAGVAAWYLYNNWSALFPTVTAAVTGTPAPPTCPSTQVLIGGVCSPEASAGGALQSQRAPITAAQSPNTSGIPYGSPAQSRYGSVTPAATPSAPAPTGYAACIQNAAVSNLPGSPQYAIAIAQCAAPSSSPAVQNPNTNVGMRGLNVAHFRKVHLVNPRGRSSNGNYVPSGNTSPQGRF